MCLDDTERGTTKWIGAKAWTPSLLPVSRLTSLKLAVTRYQRNKIKLLQGAQFTQYQD